jgi:hypothetical protein
MRFSNQLPAGFRLELDISGKPECFGMPGGTPTLHFLTMLLDSMDAETSIFCVILQASFP